MASVETWLAARRVPLGFAAAVVVLGLARPTWPSWAAGLAIAALGEGVRVWAAGHLEKGREVTSSGPYRWTRHPLYVGSSVMAAGVAVAGVSLAAAVAIALYMGVTLRAAVRTEEAFLRARFGDAYDAYAERRAAPSARRFSLARARQNREYRTLAGLAAGFGLLALKVGLSL
jgi:protein-S-isoprenylcysteine O-methyltransferase Ste14